MHRRVHSEFTVPVTHRGSWLRVQVSFIPTDEIQQRLTQTVVPLHISPAKHPLLFSDGVSKL